MKNSLILLLVAQALLLGSCGNKAGNGTAETDSTTVTTQRPSEPYADPTRDLPAQARHNGSTYDINVHREADTQQDCVRDALGDTFYDNKVTISIKRDGTDFFSRTIRKEAFLDFLSPGEQTSTVLQGIVFDKADEKGLHFAAQVSQPDSEGGSMFVLTVGYDGLMDIIRDNTQDVSANEPQD